MEKKIFSLDNAKTMGGDEVVISGISGVFPQSDSILEFSENLYNKVDMVSDEPRWASVDPEIPEHVGKISDIDKFDAQFFKVGYQQTKVLEPISRKILEHAYGAVFDSGNTPATLTGVKIGVFIGASFADYSACSPFHVKISSDFLIGGTSKAMFANRISYWINGTGPSYHLDFSCASSAAALEKAYHSIRHGDCDAAIVGSGNICLLPAISLNLKKAGLLCFDGKTKCFDKNADGCVRAEAISLLFLQKSKDAKRIYAEIYHAKGIYKLHPDAQFLPIRISHDIQKFLKDFYSETDIEPENVEYVEANGAAIAKADENELDAIGKVFGNKKTVKIGCVKSNMGHSEAASGLTAVTKMCIAYHKGEIPANLHYKTPLEISAVQERKVQVLTDHAKFSRGFVALNNCSFTGANYHVVLKGHYKEKNLAKYNCRIPRILLASGREESCVNKILDSLKRKPIDAEEIALLHNIFEKDIMGHTGRGYAILNTTDQGETTSVSESIDYYSGVRRPLWFVFSGMGSQWPGMGADLMRIPTFAKAIERCHKVLEPKGVDIVKIISEPDKAIFDNILNAFVGIGAVQIGLTDILKEMGLEPDYIIGHSLGEMACAYQDNTFTAEELVLATYNRGTAVLDAILVKGSMAAVGLGYKTLVNQCPPEIDIGCHNSSESSTISGPFDVMKDFVAELTNRGIFAKEVPSANIAYHSRYVADAVMTSTTTWSLTLGLISEVKGAQRAMERAMLGVSLRDKIRIEEFHRTISTGPSLLQSLRSVITHPKLRSKKWLSTSVPKEHWGDQLAKYSSPEYHTNNLLSPVLFEEVISMMPPNAVVVEIAPHGLLQAILKRSHPECTHIPLTRRGCPDAVTFLLDGIGKLYKSGYNPKVNILYPKVEFPVSTETPLLSHLVQWEHSETWPIFSNQKVDQITSISRDIIISIHDDDFSYIADRTVNGTNTIPEAALLVYVWETLAMHTGCRDITDVSVFFSDIKFNREVVVKPEAVVKLSIMISKGNDKFEISQDDNLVVSGIASCAKDIELKHIIKSPDDDFEDVRLCSDNIYKILRNRGYFYKKALKSICSFNLNRSNAFIKWTKDWVPFLDSLIQLNTLTRNYNGISQPKFIRTLKINVLEHKDTKPFALNGIDCHYVQLNETLGVTRCAGVEINNITYIDKITVNKEPDVLIERSFYPYFAMEEVNMSTALQVNLQVVAENANSRYVNLIKSKASIQSDVFKNITEITDCLLNVIINVKSCVDDNNELEIDLDRNITNVLLLSNLLKDAKKLKMLHKLITNDDFILTLEKQIPNKQTDFKDHFSVLTCMSDGKQTLILLRKLNRQYDTSYIRVGKENDFVWISRMHDELATTKKVVLVSEKQPNNGLLGLVQKLKRDRYKNITLIANLDFHIHLFNPNDDIYKDQLEKNLCVNVLKKGQWGGYYYKSCLKSKNLRNFALENVVPGNIDGLSWIERPPCSAINNIVQVCYSGLSRNDYYKANDDCNDANDSFGTDFSGIDKNCDKVMGIIQGGAVSSTVEVDPDLLWPVPDHWSLEDAATVPLPYLQAYYCLVMKVQLKKFQRVLITGGAGALGQAVISLCLHQKCTVFTTVSEMAKKKMLLSLFPQLNEKNICFLDCDNLHSVVMTNTQNQGCHLVISCATGTLREEAMKCVGFSGYFLDLSKLEMLENNNIGMSYLIKERSYRAVDISNIFKSEYADDKKYLHRCLSEGIAKGVVTPLTRVVYSPPMVSRAFRLLSTRRNRGRVLLRLRDPVTMTQGLNVLPRLGYNIRDVVIIICDEKGLGVELADKIIERGAKKIVLHMKPNNMTDYLNAKLISWSKHEVHVKLSSENLHIEAGCASIMKNAMKFGKVTEVYIIQDGKRDGNGGKDDYISAYNKKCLPVLNLDKASRCCDDIRHFTIIASLAQSSSDEYAISLSERVCELRNEMGLPALVIRFESLAEINEFQFPPNRVEPQSLSTFFNSLETSLKLKYNNVLTFNLKEKHNFNLKKINKILGVANFYDMDNEKTLQDTNLDENTLKQLSVALKNFYQIDCTIQNIRCMTIESLKLITDKKYNMDFECGMAAFYKEVDDEEDYISQQPLVVMPTLLNHNNENNIDPTSSYLIMIPGFEGRIRVLKCIAERLKIQAVGIHLGPDMEGDSFPEIAKNVRKLLKVKFQTKSTFYILGYSFGVNIALELANIFEREGHIGVVYCIDSSPDALRVHLDSYMGCLSEDKLQNTILNHMYCIMTGGKNKNITRDLETNDSFADKVDCTLKKLKGLATYSKQYQRQVLEAAYKRIKLAREYEPDIKLSSELILMKSTPHPNAENLAKDYNLSKYTKKPIKVFSLESDHGLAYQDTRVPNIVNKFLAKKILEEFRNVNLCNVYSTDSVL